MQATMLRNLVEAALMAAHEPLSISQLLTLFDEHDTPSEAEIRRSITALQCDTEGRGIELIEVASGFRFQVRSTYAPWVSRLWQERSPRYSRALLETLALIAYRQPITRGEIEDVRGVVVSSNMIRTLLERDWVKVVGYKEVPGRPALYATTASFLDYFGLQHLQQLPELKAIQDLAAQEHADRQRLMLSDDLGVATDIQPSPSRSASDIAQHEAAVLHTTAQELASAEALLAQVEKNVFNSAANTLLVAPSDFGGLVARQQKRLAQTNDDIANEHRSMIASDVISATPSKPSGETEHE